MGSETTQWDGTLPEELERYLTPVEDEQEQLLRFEQLMGWERGTEASEALNATDFRIRRLHQLREEAFHRISLVVREYRELLASRATPTPPADMVELLREVGGNATIRTASDYHLSLANRCSLLAESLAHIQRTDAR